METAVYKMVQGEIAGRDSILLQVGKILSDPLNELFPVITALIDGIQFAANAGTHGYEDCREAAVHFLKAQGAQTPVHA